MVASYRRVGSEPIRRARVGSGRPHSRPQPRVLRCAWMWPAPMRISAMAPSPAAPDDRALHDPAGHFGEPEAVLRSPDLTAEQKKMILERWRQIGGSPISGRNDSTDLATRLARALAFLDTETA